MSNEMQVIKTHILGTAAQMSPEDKAHFDLKVMELRAAVPEGDIPAILAMALVSVERQ